MWKSTALVSLDAAFGFIKRLFGRVQLGEIEP
jgi:hypothetical protein